MRHLRLFTLLILGAGLLVSSCTKGGDGGTGNEHQAAHPPQSPALTEHQCIDLNKATAEELTRLPGVGEVIARRIVDYRAQHGPLRRAQEIIIVEGFSERKFRAIAEFVCVE